MHRLDLEYRDKMQIASELKEKLGSIKDVADKLGVSEQTLRNYLGYSAVPESNKNMVNEGILSASTATRISKNIPDEEETIKIAEKIKEIPIGKYKREIIDIAHENPEKSVKEIIETTQDRTKMKSITIYVTQSIYNAI